MGDFTVTAIHTRDGIVEDRETEQFGSISEAFAYFGRQCARTNGVIITDENGGVWAEFTPSQIEKPSSWQIKRYQLYLGAARAA